MASIFDGYMQDIDPSLLQNGQLGGTQNGLNIRGYSNETGGDGAPQGSDLTFLGYSGQAPGQTGVGSNNYDFDASGKYTGTHQTEADNNWKYFLMSAAAMAGGAAFMGEGVAGAGVGEAVDPMVYGGSGAATWGGDASVIAAGGGAGAEVDPMMYGGGTAGTYGAGGATTAGVSDAGLTSLASSDQAFAKALADSGLSQSSLSNILSGLGIKSTDLAGLASSLGGWQQLLGGIASIYAGNKGNNTANNILAKGDPFGQYRQYFGDQLMALEKDPTLITKSPGFSAGEQAVQRSMASQGYNGSGNMATALMDYGNNFFGSREAALAKFAGSDINPNSALQTAAQVQGGSTASEMNGIINVIKGLSGIGSGFTGGAAP